MSDEPVYLEAKRIPWIGPPLLPEQLMILEMRNAGFRMPMSNEEDDEVARYYQSDRGTQQETLMFITVDPMNSGMRRHKSQESATAWAIAANKNDPDHPAYELWEFVSDEGKYVGSLFREFGYDFDPTNCWR